MGGLEKIKKAAERALGEMQILIAIVDIKRPEGDPIVADAQAAYDALEQALRREESGEPRQGGEPSGLVWSREKPTEQIRAIVCYTPRHGVMLRTVAEFIPHKTVRSEDFLSEDCDPGDCDWYDKEEDCYWVNEGWWESSYVADTNWQLDGEVTHWMPLPPAPRTQASPPAEAPEAEQTTEET
jgi:hypothetical protein